MQSFKTPVWLLLAASVLEADGFHNLRRQCQVHRVRLELYARMLLSYVAACVPQGLPFGGEQCMSLWLILLGNSELPYAEIGHTTPSNAQNGRLWA